MAKPISTALKPVGAFFALKSQNTLQAPSPTAEPVARPGVLPGYPYNVLFAVRVNNILWVLLESATPMKYEWARADMSTSTGEVEYGAYVGPVFGE